MITLRGNSLARGMEIEGVRVVARGGVTLKEMMREAEEDEGTTIFLFGIPDICRRGEARMRQWAKDELVNTIGSARGRREWVLGTFYPPRDCDVHTFGAVRSLNNLIGMVNGHNGNGTIPFHSFMYYRERGTYFIKCSKYEADGVHWTAEARGLAEGKVRDWMEVRRGVRTEQERDRGVREQQERERDRKIAEEEERCEIAIEEYRRMRIRERDEKVAAIKEEYRARGVGGGVEYERRDERMDQGVGRGVAVGRIRGERDLRGELQDREEERRRRGEL